MPPKGISATNRACVRAQEPWPLPKSHSDTRPHTKERVPKGGSFRSSGNTYQRTINIEGRFIRCERWQGSQSHHGRALVLKMWCRSSAVDQSRRVGSIKRNSIWPDIYYVETGVGGRGGGGEGKASPRTNERTNERGTTTDTCCGERERHGVSSKKVVVTSTWYWTKKPMYCRPTALESCGA